MNAIRLILGVLLGLLVGDLALLSLGTGPGVMALAVFGALAVSRSGRTSPRVP